MAFLSVKPDGSVKRRRATKNTKNSKRRPEGIVYILKMYLGPKDDMQVVYKIGVTARKTRALESRVSEICTDHYIKNRYFPYVEPRKFSKTPYYFEIEAYMHKRYKDKRYFAPVKFDGCSELFSIEDEDELLEHYKEVMKNPLDYITPTEKAEKIQDRVEENKKESDSSINDIDPSIE